MYVAVTGTGARKPWREALVKTPLRLSQAALAAALAMALLICPAPLLASGAGPDTLTVYGHAAEVTVLSSTRLRIAVDGEVWTYERSANGASLSGPVGSQADPQLLDAIVAEWGRLHPNWVNPPPPSSGWSIVVGLGVIGLGAAEIWRPRLFWFLSDGWKFRSAEPSDLALSIERLGGVITIIIGLVILFY